MTHKKISLIKSWMRIIGLMISFIVNDWQFGVLILILAEVVGIWEEKFEDTIPHK